ncbi:uncharacterized protein B0I36DRAFT_359095 [Microdochium trichocladiopsis]|uniref:Uncharacterized protein n=1 Tax=Microdochium trichocladiopsis TaxID=1682393 RepID=A0A9P8YE86_9PEZI|nr:uncharacterized protein B0I36DRAFT_359095 [Microdochium trichocladiopsis]KAH7037386.1 hypothetical protein B0I36DRAFT_359095 [Microdochium trichocladiopsis]
MGAVVSCIRDAFRAIGRAIMAVVSGIGGIITAIVNGIVSFIGVIVGFLTCGYCGGKRHGRTGGTRGHHSTRTSRV